MAIPTLTPRYHQGAVLVTFRPVGLSWALTRCLIGNVLTLASVRELHAYPDRVEVLSVWYADETAEQAVHAVTSRATATMRDEWTWSWDVVSPTQA